MGDVKHECGVAAVYLKKPLSQFDIGGAANYLQVMLEQQQPRGRLSAGVVVHSEQNKGLRRHVGPGLVSQVFRLSEKKRHRSLMEFLSSSSGVGHVRYATSGDGVDDEAVLNEAQPELREHGMPRREFALAYNGNLTNAEKLLKELVTTYKYAIRTAVDTELMKHFLSIELDSVSGDHHLDLESLVERTAARLDGAYSVVMVNGEGHLIAFRDPHGFRPLVWGQTEDVVAIASETIALEKVGVRKFNDVPAGGYVIVNDQGIRPGTYAEPSLSHCMFEFVYFAAAPSFIEGKSVDLVRERLGQELAKIEPLRDKLSSEYIIVPVPDTSIPIAQAMANVLGLECVHAIYQNRALGRGFINKSGERGRIIRDKYTIVKRRVKEKKLIVVDDSIVRGETFDALNDYLWANDPLEVHLRSACPPIRYPCFYGIDFPTMVELIASGTGSIAEAEEKIKRQMNLTSMKYLDIDGIVRAIGIPKNNLCMACLNGEYPTKEGRERFQNLTLEGEMV